MSNILKLPLPAEKFIPHRLPMRLVDTIISFGNAAGLVVANILPDCILLGTDGCLDSVAFVELMAQGYATIKGYDDTLNGKKISEGYLVSVKEMSVSGKAYVGDRLLVNIQTIGSFEGFAVAEGKVTRGDEIVAAGTLKLWIVTPDGAP